MARKQMITRTKASTVADLLCMNIVTQKAETITVELFQTFNSKQAAFKAFSKYLANNEEVALRPVQITKLHETKKLYGMTEADFMKHAVELDKVTRKPITD